MSYSLEPGTLVRNESVLIAEWMRLWSMMVITNWQAWLGEILKSIAAWNSFTRVLTWSLNDVSVNVWALTSWSCTKLPWMSFTDAIDTKHISASNRNWAAAVRRKSSGVKLVVLVSSNDAIHSGDTSSLEHTCCWEEYQPYVMKYSNGTVYVQRW